MLFINMHLEIILIALLWAVTFVREIRAVQSGTLNKIANVGETLRLKCPDTDVSSFVISWKYQSNNTVISSGYNISSTLPVDIQERYSIISKEDSRFTLRILDVRESDATVYECGYSDGKQSKRLFLINVTVLSTDDAHPLCSLDSLSASSIFTSSSSITFTCSIKPHQLGKGDVLQWVRDDKTLSSDNQKNSVSYTRKVIPDDLNKLYECQLVNTNSKRVIEECRIQTFENPVVLSKEVNYVKLGSDLLVSCDVRSSSDNPTWTLPNEEIRTRSSFLENYRKLYISNISISDNTTEIICSYGDYTRKAMITVVSENDIVLLESTTSVVALKEFKPAKDKEPDQKGNKDPNSKENKPDKSFVSPTFLTSSDGMDVTPTNQLYSTSSSFKHTNVFNINEAVTSTPSSPTYISVSPSPTEPLTGFQEFLQMVHMSYWVFIAAAVGTFIFLVLILILAVCCYKYVQSKRPARLAISDSFYSGLANVHKNTNYPLNYNAMRKRAFDRHSGASSLFGDDDMEGSNLLEIIVQGKFPDNSDMQFSDTLDHCNPDDSCLSSAKDFGNLATGTKDYGTSADTLDGTDEGICSGSGETRFDFDFDLPVNTKHSKGSQDVCDKDGAQLSVVKDTLC